MDARDRSNAGGAPADDAVMDGLVYQRFDLPRPQVVPEEQWTAIDAEIERVERALACKDKAQAVGSLKDLVEAIARSVKELNGEPAGAGEAAEKVIARAHELLRTQPGPEVTNISRAGRIANSACKISREIPDIRNAVGTGHGRAAVPEITDDELTLLLDGALMWSRWALRRLDDFCMGRPTQLVDDLQHQNWTKGKLARRLAATDLTNEDIAHQIGHAVGRRAASGTFTVSWDGIEAPGRTDDLQTWPAAYRRAAARALLFDTTGNTPRSAAQLADAIRLVRPTLDEASWAALVNELLDNLPDPADLTDGTEDQRYADQLTTELQEIASQGEPFAEAARHLAHRFGTTVRS